MVPWYSSVAVCCSVLQCVAVCCSTWQCDTESRRRVTFLDPVSPRRIPRHNLTSPTLLSEAPSHITAPTPKAQSHATYSSFQDTISHHLLFFSRHHLIPHTLLSFFLRMPRPHLTPPALRFKAPSLITAKAPKAQSHLTDSFF